MKVKILALALAAFTLFNTTIQAHADEMEVIAQLPSSFSITLPKYITIGQDMTAGFKITAEGDTASDEHLSVTTDHTFTLTSKSGETAQANISLNKTKLSLLSGSDTITGQITASELSAGEWTSTITFLINLVKETTVEIGQCLTLQSYDITPIPDKYNTGADMVTCVEAIPETGVVLENGLQFRDDDGTMCYIDFNKSPNSTASGEYVFENINFSSKTGWVGYGNVTNYQGTGVKLIFNNCKFYNFKSNNDNELIECEFNNCSFRSVAGSNMVFNECFFGGQSEFETVTDDAMMPGTNVVFNNCYCADLIVKTEMPGRGHLDGMQTLKAQDLYFNNCRWEVPDINYTSKQGEFSYAIFIQSDSVENVIFDHCYINGGGYYSISVTDSDPINCRIIEPFIGGSFYGDSAFYPNNSSYTNSAEAVTENPKLYDSIYVSSVWKDNDGTANVIVTNDTLVDRTLRIITEDGYTDHVIPRTYRPAEYEADTKDFTDLPIDLKYTVTGDAEYIVCYDITDINNPKQVRFVNWTTEPVYIEKNWGIIQ